MPRTRQLQDQQQPTDISAAGILPFYRDNDTGEVHFLLCKEKYSPGWQDSGKWSDFGGHRDTDDELPEEIAAREFYEESMGTIFPSIKAILDHMKQHTVYTNDTPLYPPRMFRMFVVEIPFIANLNVWFQKAINFTRFSHTPNAEQLIEKVEVKWFSGSKLHNVLFGIQDDDELHPRPVLRSSFAQSLYLMMNEFKFETKMFDG
jgi:ADP-ribose pyrophosphatase YjhB (NUDIX family)